MPPPMSAATTATGSQERSLPGRRVEEPASGSPAVPRGAVGSAGGGYENDAACCGPSCGAAPYAPGAAQDGGGGGGGDEAVGGGSGGGEAGGTGPRPPTAWRGA